MTKTFSSIQGCLPGLTWGKNEHCQPLVALRPLDADKPFIFPPREARKTTLNTGKRFPHLENVKRIEQSTISHKNIGLGVKDILFSEILDQQN